MTRFEEIGVGFQQNAMSKRDADRSFHSSCRCCCERGMRLNCDRCAIFETHSIMISIFQSREKTEVRMVSVRRKGVVS